MTTSIPSGDDDSQSEAGGILRRIEKSVNRGLSARPSRFLSKNGPEFRTSNAAKTGFHGNLCRSSHAARSRTRHLANVNHLGAFSPCLDSRSRALDRPFDLLRTNVDFGDEVLAYHIASERLEIYSR